MIAYEVTLDVDPTLVPALERYMREKHIPEIFASGCFRRIRFDRASATRFRTSYQAATRADLDRYLQDHAPHFRADFAARKLGGAVPTREIWTNQESWPADGYL